MRKDLEVNKIPGVLIQFQHILLAVTPNCAPPVLSQNFVSVTSVPQQGELTFNDNFHHHFLRNSIGFIIVN